MICVFSKVEVLPGRFLINETQISETNNLKVTIGALKFDGRIIPEANNLNTLKGTMGSL